jgi:type VI secretion system secreted protein VgrG
MSRTGNLKMNTNYFLISKVVALVALTEFLPACHADLSLGSASTFAALGATTVTSDGATMLTGDLGVSPGAAITGFGPGVVNGTTHLGDGVAAQAQSDAMTAYATAAGLAPGHSLSGQDLGGLVLDPGIYDFATAAQLTGILTLNAAGDPNAQFIFQVGTTLTTAVSSSVILENGALAGGVVWQVGTSATLGADTTFVGDVLADQSISLNLGASLSGSAVALTGAVTLSDNAITVATAPEPNSCFSAALCALSLGLGWRFRSQRKLSEKRGGTGNPKLMPPAWVEY